MRLKYGTAKNNNKEQSEMNIVKLSFRKEFSVIVLKNYELIKQKRHDKVHL